MGKKHIGIDVGWEISKIKMKASGKIDLVILSGEEE